MLLYDHFTFFNNFYITISFLLSFHFGWSIVVLLWEREDVIIVVKSVAIAINRDEEDNDDYDRTTIVLVFSLASSIEEMHAFYNPFFAP